MNLTFTQSRLTDEEAVRQYLQTGQEMWFTLLHKRHCRKVYRLCLSITKDPFLAEDTTQDIFLRMLNKLDQYEGRASFSSWLYSLAYHYCLGIIRKSSRLPLVPLDDKFDIAGQEPEDDFSVRLSRVKEVMASLSADEQMLLHLKYEENLSIHDIANRYATTDGSIKMRLKRTRARILVTYNRQED